MHENETHFGDTLTITGIWKDCDFVDCHLTLEGDVLMDGCTFVGGEEIGGTPRTAFITNCVFDPRSIEI
jgi:hypothetical protein